LVGEPPDRRVPGGELALDPGHPGNGARRDGRIQRFVRAVVQDLLRPENRGRSAVCIGPGQPPGAHAAVHRINGLLGNVGEGKPVSYTQVPQPQRAGYAAAIKTLADAMRAGSVNTLLILGGNPVYNAPGDVSFGDALQKVQTTIHLSLYRDETSRQCTWHLPRVHFLEAWGDVRSYDGTYSVIQPMIAPLLGGRSSLEVLAMILQAARPEPPVGRPEELVRRTFRSIAGQEEAAWQRALRDGLLADSRWPVEHREPSGVAGVGRSQPPDVERLGAASGRPPATPGAGEVRLGAASGRPPATPTALPVIEPQDGQLEVVFCRDASVYDGRFGNSGWLQELPDPLTRLTWGNAALISPADARRLGIDSETLVTLKVGDRPPLRLPAYVLPGQAAGSITLPLGYGRTAAGKVGGSTADNIEPVGMDVYPLRTTATMTIATGVVLEPTGVRYVLASTQDHHTIDAVGRQGREDRLGSLIRQATLEQYLANPDFAREVVHHPPLKSLWQEPPYEGHRWAMSIDLSRCTGCGACVVACQAENNIPVVGKERVLRGREMHWLRVDRYFRGEADEPEVALQPVPCQQCELAPCEQVCPVAATTHSREGLNDMVYNRCVGTRYCANNCPYKVRRFNYFNFHKDLEDPDNEVAKLKYNPQVTVRSRGVMEKCTYCVQRIQAAKIAAGGALRRGGMASAHTPHRETIRDGEIQTACQQVCPTGAIVFGDLADEQSRVRKLHAADRAYAMLAELNVRPRTLYLARIRNPNPQLETADATHDGHHG
jgi:molybdopterin-containing oxidoreductase family iron-sulfur binding subunit